MDTASHENPTPEQPAMPPSSPPGHEASGAGGATHGAQHLHRVGRGRMLAGVAGGVADYFDVDPTLVRIGFVALAFLGGLAVPLYLAGWALIPDEDSDLSVAEELLARERAAQCVLSAPRDRRTEASKHRRLEPTIDTNSNSTTSIERTEMRYRWDPAYPMGRRDTQPVDAYLRASDDERSAVADKLSRHYAEGRLDETEFKTRLDTAMSATTRGDLNGLFRDLPSLPSALPPPPPRHRRVLPWVFLFAFLAIVTTAAIPFYPHYPLFRVPWFLVFIVGLVLWRRAAGQRWHRQYDRRSRSSVMDH